jgi:hypothetical protein
MGVLTATGLIVGDGLFNIAFAALVAGSGKADMRPWRARGLGMPLGLAVWRAGRLCLCPHGAGRGDQLISWRRLGPLAAHRRTAHWRAGRARSARRARPRIELQDGAGALRLEPAAIERAGGEVIARPSSR